MKKLLIVFIALLTVANITSCTDSSSQETPVEKIKVGGSSEGYSVIEVLAEAKKNDSIEINFMPSSQSSGGIRGVKDGLIDIGVISQQLTAAETSDKIKYIPIVRNLQFLITNEKVTGVKNLSTKQIQDIYSGTINNWKELGGPDAEIILLDIPEDETEKQILRKHHLGENLKITPKAIIFQEDDQVIKSISSTPYSIALVANTQELEEFTIQILSIDNAMPNKANVENGKYKMAQTIGIVISSQPTSVIQKFVDFISTQEAKQKLELAGYTVLDLSGKEGVGE